MEYPDGANWQRAGNKGMEFCKVKWLETRSEGCQLKMVLVETTGFFF